MTATDTTVTARDRPDVNGHKPSPYPGTPSWVADAERAEARDIDDQRAADRHRALDLAPVHAGADDALADLRKCMSDNADVFKSSRELAHIARAADAHGAEGYGVLFGVLIRAVLAVPPAVVLPPIIGGEVSLNLMQALAGVSGGGKGTADKTAAAAVRFKVGNRERREPVMPMLPIGTGEGINRTYARAERDKLGNGQVALRWHTDRALFGCRDIATFASLTGRKGTTLVPELLKAYMGEELGFANAEAERRVILPQHSYRLCLSAGVQPANGHVLLNEQAERDGMPQRFIWSPVRPGTTRDRRCGVGAVEPMTVTVPDFGIDPMVFEIKDEDDDQADTYDPAAQTLVPMGVATTIAAEIVAADAAKDADPFGRSGDPLAGHRLLAQLKLAAGLAILHNTTYVGHDNWDRAQRLMEVSTAVSRAVAIESAAAADHDAVQRGKLDGRRLAAADESRETAALQSLTDRLRRYLAQQTDWVSHGAVNRSVTSKLRRNLNEGLSCLLAEGVIVHQVVEIRGQKVAQYRMKAV